MHAFSSATLHELFSAFRDFIVLNVACPAQDSRTAMSDSYLEILL